MLLTQHLCSCFRLIFVFKPFLHTGSGIPEAKQEVSPRNWLQWKLTEEKVIFPARFIPEYCSLWFLVYQYLDKEGFEYKLQNLKHRLLNLLSNAPAFFYRISVYLHIVSPILAYLSLIFTELHPSLTFYQYVVECHSIWPWDSAECSVKPELVQMKMIQESSLNDIIK